MNLPCRCAAKQTGSAEAGVGLAIVRIQRAWRIVSLNYLYEFNIFPFCKILYLIA
jgi:hypothetical protein